MKKSKPGPTIIGVSGISGAGKTHVISAVQKASKSAISVLNFDDYYLPLKQQQRDKNGFINFDLPTALDANRFVNDLKKLASGEDIVIQKYQYENYSLPSINLHIAASDVIFVDGLFVFEIPEIDKMLNYRIMVVAKSIDCLQRRLKRDQNERGIPDDRSAYQWINHVIPSWSTYIVPHATRCDLICFNYDGADVAQEIIEFTGI